MAFEDSTEKSHACMRLSAGTFLVLCIVIFMLWVGLPGMKRDIVSAIEAQCSTSQEGAS